MDRIIRSSGSNDDQRIICFFVSYIFDHTFRLPAVTLVISNVFLNDIVHVDQLLSSTPYMPLVSFYTPFL